MKVYYFIRMSCFRTGQDTGEALLFFGRQWPHLMIIHYKDLSLADRMFPKPTKQSRRAPSWQFRHPPCPPHFLSILSQAGMVEDDASPTYSSDRRCPVTLLRTIDRNPLSAAGQTQIDVKTRYGRTEKHPNKKTLESLQISHSFALLFTTNFHPLLIPYRQAP